MSGRASSRRRRSRPGATPAGMLPHLGAKTAAVAELRRVARAGGHVIVRQVTRESADEYEYVRFFPDALGLDLRRMPSRDGLTRAFLAEGFGRAGHRIVRHLFARSYAEYHRKISLRGLAAFERHCRAQGAGPIYEPVELFVFRRT